MSGLLNSRGQDVLLVLRSLQKIANAAVRHREVQLQRFWKYSSLRKATLPAVPKGVASLTVNEVAQKSAIVLDNTLVFGQAFTSSSIQHLLNGAEYPARRRPKPNFVEVDYAEEPVAEHEVVEVLEPNRNVSSLDIIETVADLSDEKEIQKTAFIKKVIAKKKVAVETKQRNENEEMKLRFQPKPGSAPVGALGTKLSSSAKERAVPSTRIGRLMNFGGLGLGLGAGIVTEASKRALGLSKSNQSGALLDGSLILNEANAERIVKTLCKVRGAALKLGQMLSIQDEALISPELSRIFERVRESADFMPVRQMEKVMINEFGHDWREKHFAKFTDQPFAAASIGQVHCGETLSGLNVAVKIQYPGVAKGIESDINNLMSVLNVANILPERFFADRVVQHMKIELAQECDYLREAACCRKMRELLVPYPEYYVPKVVDELTTKQVFTTELISGLTIDQCAKIEDQETRDYITLIILELLLRELFIFRYMQTDPNWANFLFNPETNQLGLLDFGATREYRPFFVNNYFKIIEGAAKGDRDQILEYSKTVGFLTGYESKIMNDAHVESVMILGEAFRTNDKFNFGQQKTTARMQEMVSIMLQHRLCPPPPEVYSLHRKMSGLFLLATKLKSSINCYPVWNRIAEEFVPHKEEPQIY